jgi:DUF1365 family protein
MKPAEPRIFFGKVMHARLRPRRNAFTYGVFFLRLPLSRIHATGAGLFSINRWNLFSFHFADHGARDGSPPEPWIRALLKREGVHDAQGEIVLQTFPRVLGYVFNPVSFWLCHDRAGGLRAILCEVNNTFGERHNYLLAALDGGPIRPGQTLGARKVFHVSPFCRIEGHYRFRFSECAGGCHVAIDYDCAGGTVLSTAIWGQSAPLTKGNLVRAFVLYPWMTLGVIARIHWQALKLYLKGVRYVPKPLPPAEETTR